MSATEYAFALTHQLFRYDQLQANMPSGARQAIGIDLQQLLRALWRIVQEHPGLLSEEMAEWCFAGIVASESGKK